MPGRQAQKAPSKLAEGANARCATSVAQRLWLSQSDGPLWRRQRSSYTCRSSPLWARDEQPFTGVPSCSICDMFSEVGGRGGERRRRYWWWGRNSHTVQMIARMRIRRLTSVPFWFSNLGTKGRRNRWGGGMAVWASCPTAWWVGGDDPPPPPTLSGSFCKRLFLMWI